jgi:hypothetical protein
MASGPGIVVDVPLLTSLVLMVTSAGRCDSHHDRTLRGASHPWTPWSVPWSRVRPWPWRLVASAARRLTAVDMQGLAGDERGPFEIQDPVDDVVDLAQPAKGVKAGEPLVGRELVHRDARIVTRAHPTR